jgi:geranylgeranyl diphosphate synthase type I
MSACLAVELLQSYLLIQDDWMDADRLRRGKLAVHYGFLAEYKNEHLANSVAILVSDLASAFAEEIMSHSGFDAEPVRRAMRTYSRMHQSVILGQYLDVSGNSTVDLVHQLKTASYTVIGPLLLGAELAMAKKSQLHTLREFGHKLGVAFQLKDDLIGTFGNSDATGKATDADIRSRKRTALTAELFRQADPGEHTALAQLLNPENMNTTDIQRIRQIFVDRGIRESIEIRAQSLADDAIKILRDSNLSVQGKDMLLTLTDMLTRRTH